ncbi:MAG: hypothetical protein KDC05_02090 [Bacteroidales bacterium]|nr:hypothetical protein [Bacteroidales bacterium]
MNKLLILCFIAVIGLGTEAISQEKSIATVELTEAQQQAIDDAVAMDPKLTAEEIENLKLAVLGAPVEAQPMHDPKLENEPTPVAAPAGAQPIVEREDALPVTETIVTAKTIEMQEQPAPEKLSTGQKFRVVNGQQEQAAPSTTAKQGPMRQVNGSQSQPDPSPEMK